MNLVDQRGFLSIKSIVVLLLVFGGGAFLFGPARMWANAAVERDAERSAEFNRRVKARRHAAIAPELAQAGIVIDGGAPAPTALEPAIAEPEAPKPSLVTRVVRWWARIRGPRAPVEPLPVPVFRDSLGLLPGERAYLPNGRVVEYDTTAYHFYQPTVRGK